MPIQPWHLLRSELVIDHPWYRLRRDHVRLPNGEELDDYFVSVRPHGAFTFALTPGNEVLFVRQYKHGAGQIVLELPGGVVDPHETAAVADAARRELREETGYDTPLPLEPLLLDLFENATKDTSQVSFFLAREATPTVAQKLDASENIEVVLVPLAEVAGLVLRGDIRGTNAVALCLLALRHLGV